MRLVIVESPYAGDVERNVRYGRAALADCLRRGEAPIASHLLLTQPGVLDDSVPADRTLGMLAGHAWYAGADACVVYNDLGLSNGMKLGIVAAQAAGVPIEWRSLGGPWDLGEVPQPRLLDEGVICDRCGRKWDPAKGEGSGCEACLTAIQAARGGR